MFQCFCFRLYSFIFTHPLCFTLGLLLISYTTTLSLIRLKIEIWARVLEPGLFITTFFTIFFTMAIFSSNVREFSFKSSLKSISISCCCFPTLSLVSSNKRRSFSFNCSESLSVSSAPLFSDSFPKIIRSSTLSILSLKDWISSLMVSTLLDIVCKSFWSCRL